MQKGQTFENYILEKLQILSLRLSLSLRTDSYPSVYPCKHLLKNVEKIKQTDILRTLTSQQEDFADLDIFIFCLDVFSNNIYSFLMHCFITN